MINFIEFVNENTKNDYKDYSSSIEKQLKKFKTSDIQINNSKIISARSDDFTGNGEGQISINVQRNSVKIEIVYEIDFVYTDKNTGKSDVNVDLIIDVIGDREYAVTKEFKKIDSVNFNTLLTDFIQQSIQKYVK